MRTTARRFRESRFDRAKPLSINRAGNAVVALIRRPEQRDSGLQQRAHRRFRPPSERQCRHKGLGGVSCASVLTKRGVGGAKRDIENNVGDRRAKRISIVGLSCTVQSLAQNSVEPGPIPGDSLRS